MFLSISLWPDMRKNNHWLWKHRLPDARTWRPIIGLTLAACLMTPWQVAGAQSLQQPTGNEATKKDEVAETSGAETDSAPKYRTERIRGQVVWLADALKSQFGITTVPEVAENVLAILTPDGQLLPIVENLRGRAFRKDERLRGKEMEIWVRRYEAQPLIQVLRVFEISDGDRYEIDYWCDVCAIVMYETGPCSCCQDDNRLRKRKVESEDELQ